MKNKKYISPMEEFSYIDTNATYIIPMSKVGSDRRIDYPQEVKIKLDKYGNVIVEKYGYNMKVFGKSYFSYLRDTGHIKVV